MNPEPTVERCGHQRRALPLLLAAIAASALCAAPGCKGRASPSGSAPHASAKSAAPLPPPSTVPPPSAPDHAGTDTVSHASEIYDASAPVVGNVRVNGRELRRRHAARLRSDRSAVTVLRGESALELGERICEVVVPKRPPHTKILLKPNICGFDGIKQSSKSGDNGVSGRITDPEFVRGVLRCLKRRGHDRVTVAEGCGLSHQHFLDTIRVSGFQAMAEQEGVPLVALDDDGVFDVEGERPGEALAIDGIGDTRVPTLLLPRLLAETLEHGLFISVPKLKAHRYAVVSVGIKGMQGTVMRSDAAPAYNQKWRMHAELKDYLRAQRHHQPEDRASYVRSLELFAARMVDVLELSLPDVVLVDGAPAMSGDGFQNLRRVPGMVALGGTNPILVDSVGARYLGLYDNAALAAELGGHRTSPLIEVAAKRYGVSLAEPLLSGDGVAALSEARPLFFKAIAPFTLDGDRTIVPAPAAEARESAELPSAHAARTVAPPIIDGQLDAAWERAVPVTFATDYRGDATDIPTRVRFLWSEHALYTLFEVSRTKFNTDASFPLDRERPKLYQEDCVELFLAPDPSRRSRYYEIELGPLGHFFDLEVDRDAKKENVDWSSGATVRASQDRPHGSAIIEARFTAPELVSVMRPGARLPLGLYRVEGRTARRYLAWSPPRTPKPNFHVPEAFGTLSIDP